MMAVTSNGFILNVYGPFSANYSDAKILNDIIDTDIFKKIFKTGYVFVVDRGFRDNVDKLKNKGFQVKMPSYIDKDDKQLTTKQANYSRMVTKMFGQIKVFHI